MICGVMSPKVLATLGASLLADVSSVEVVRCVLDGLSTCSGGMMLSSERLFAFSSSAIVAIGLLLRLFGTTLVSSIVCSTISPSSWL